MNTERHATPPTYLEHRLASQRCNPDPSCSKFPEPPSWQLHEVRMNECLKRTPPQLTLVHVARFKNEMRAFPPKFEGHLLKIALCGRFHYFATCDSRPGKSITHRLNINEVLCHTDATLSTSGCAAKAAPPTGPREGTVLTTPGGNLQE